MTNFQKRVISSVVGGAIMIFLLIIGGEFLLAAMCVVSVVGLLELTKACGVHEEGKKINILEAIGIFTTILWYGLIEYAWIMREERLLFGVLVLIICVLLHMVAYVLTFPRFNANQIMASIFSFVYCPVMISFIYLTRSLHHGLYLVWLVFVCSWICDIFAYLVGVKFGKRRFVPKLSPKKSLEGAIGGVAGSSVIGAIYAYFLLAPQISGHKGLAVIIVVIISAIGAMISMFGDLAASAIKRNNDLKDYGKLIPGHGGVMDRFDSVIFTAPVVYYLALVFLHFVG